MQAASVNMEEEFLNLGLDIIGLGVFNYDFGSITTESPVIQAVYGLLKEAEHRSTFYIPYWDLPLARCVFFSKQGITHSISISYFVWSAQRCQAQEIQILYPLLGLPACPVRCFLPRKGQCEIGVSGS